MSWKIQLHKVEKREKKYISTVSRKTFQKGDLMEKSKKSFKKTYTDRSLQHRHY